MYGGGVAALALLAFSLIAASCSNDSDSNAPTNPSNPNNPGDNNSSGSAPNPTLPSSVGDNPIKKETKLCYCTYNDNTDGKPSIWEDEFLVMKNDGTAEYHNSGDLEYVFKYTWDTSKNGVYMKVEKIPYDDGTLLNYDESVSQINKDSTVTKVRENLQKEFESWQTQRHQDYGAKTYEDYEAALLKDYGCKSFEEYVKLIKEYSLKYLNSIFGAKVTYGYELNGDGKMTLTEKFTGVKNLLRSECYYGGDGIKVYIDPERVLIDKRVNGNPYEEWYGEFGTGKTIKFEEEDSKEKKDGSYTEDIDKGTVTVHFDGKDYPCEFRGKNFIEENK